MLVYDSSGNADQPLTSSPRTVSIRNGTSFGRGSKPHTQNTRLSLTLPKGFISIFSFLHHNLMLII